MDVNEISMAGECRNQTNGNEGSATFAESEKSEDLETAITKTGYGLFNWMMMALILPVACTGISCNSTMSYVISAAQQLDLTPQDKALLLSAPFAGMVISGYLWGLLSDEMGRKNIMVVGFLLDVVLNIGCATIKSVVAMSIFKFFSGLIVVGPYSIFMVYISEVFSRRQRDVVAQFMGVFTSIGSMAQAGFAMWLIPKEMPDWLGLTSWQLFILLCGLPSLMVGLASVFFYESPKFLVDKGRFQQALVVCKNIYAINAGRTAAPYSVKKLAGTISDNSEHKKISDRLMEAGDLFRTPFLNKAIISFLYFIILFIGQNMIRMWTPEIFTILQSSNKTWDSHFCLLFTEGSKEEMSLPQNSVYRKMMIIHATCTSFHFLYLLIVNVFGKKNLLIGDAVIAGLCIVSIPFLPAGYMPIISAAYMALSEMACYAFLGVVVQLFPTHLRAQSLSLTMAIGRLGVVIGNFVLSEQIHAHCEYTFYSLGAGSIGMVILLILLNFTPHDDSKATH